MTYRLADADFNANVTKLLDERQAYFSSLSNRDSRKAKSLAAVDALRGSIQRLEAVFEKSLEKLLGAKAVNIHEKIATAINPDKQFTDEQVASLFADMHRDLNKVNDGFGVREREILAGSVGYEGERMRLNTQRIDGLRTVVRQFVGLAKELLDYETIDQYLKLQMVLRQSETYGADLVSQALPTGDKLQDGAVLRNNIVEAKRMAYSLQAVTSEQYGPSLARVADFAKAISTEANKQIGKGASVAG